MPTPEQVQVLRTFADRHGRHWRAALRRAWALNWAGAMPDGKVLSDLQNTLGPAGLTTFKFPEKEHDHHLP